MATGLQQTYNLDTPRVDFNQEDFDTLITQKGNEVIIETALQCACKSSKTNQQSNCKNCGGTGWFFINPRETRIVVQAMDVINKLQPWSEEARGTLKISARKLEELAYMDKITVLNGEARFQETLHMKKKGGVLFAYTAYPVKSFSYVGLFTGINSVYTRLVEGTDYTIEDNIFKLAASYVQPGEQDISITVRYIHAPIFYMVEMTRETMQTFEWKSGERLLHMPQAGIARRAHYVLTAPNLAGDRLLDNSYDVGCIIPDCGCQNC